MHSKHGYAAAEDDSDYLDGLGIFGSSDKKNGENNEVAENGIFEDEAEGKEEDSAWIMNELKPQSEENGVPSNPNKQIEQSVHKGEVSKVIVVSGAVGATSYLNTLVLTVNSKKPYVDNKIHYNGGHIDIWSKGRFVFVFQTTIPSGILLWVTQFMSN